MLGPFKVVIHGFRQPETATSKARPGFVAAGFRNPFVAEGMEHDEDAGPALVYVNVWCTDNNAGKESGVSYCEVQWTASRFMESRERVDEDLSVALEQQMQISTEPELKKSRTETPDAQEVSPVPDTHAASETTLSREPGLVPAADAGSQEVAAEEEEDAWASVVQHDLGFPAPDEEPEGE